MPLQLSNAAIEQFKVDFELKYQAAEKLSLCSNNLFGLRGDSYQLPYMGEVVTHSRGAYQSMIPASDLEITKKSILFSNFTSNLPLDYFQNMELSAATNTLASLSDVHSKSMARRSDQFLIDAWVADSGLQIADGGTNMTVDKLKEAKSYLDTNNVPMEDRFLVCTPSQIDALLSDQTVTSILFNQQRTLVNGQIDTFLGFKVVTLGNMPEGGLPVANEIRSCFAFSKSSTYRGYQISPSVDVQWAPSWQSWLTISRLRAGAVVGQTNGVVEISCDES